MRIQLVALLAIALLMAPISVTGAPSLSRQLAPPQVDQWVPITNPSGHYVNLVEISTPYGLGYHVDSIGNSLYCYDFMGRTNGTFTVAPDGTLTVWGWFRQSDTFPYDLRPGRRHLIIYVLYTDSPESLAKRIYALTCDDGTDWKFRNITICGLYPGKPVWIGVGRNDVWASEWNQTAEWADLHISEDSASSTWSATSSPSGHAFSFYMFATPFGPAYHIDSTGYSDYSYDFYGYTNEIFTVGRTGQMRVRGWFRQYDSYYGTYLKEVNVFVVDASNPSAYYRGATVLDYTDGDSWEYKDVLIGGLTPGTQVRIGIGRHDGWLTDWQLSAEWSCVEVQSENYDQHAPGLRWNLGLGQLSNSSILVGDVNNDGGPEALVGTIDGLVYCVDCLTGSLDWTYDGLFENIYNLPDAKLALGDINGDGVSEIVVTSRMGEITCLSGDGTPNWVREIGEPVWTAPTLSDLHGDGQKEILIAAGNGNVTCTDGTGGLRWSTRIGGLILFSSPCCADFNGDNKTEIVVGSLDNKLYCLDEMGSPKWNITLSGVPYNEMTASDINNDGKLEIVAGTSEGWVYILDGDGEIVWSCKAGEEITSPIAVDDINHDGAKEMVMTVGPGFCNLTCVSYPDGLRWISPIGTPATIIRPLLAYLSDCPRMEILISVGFCLYSLTSEGTMKWGHQTAQYISGTPIAVNFDNDDYPEILIVGDTTLRCYDYASPYPTRLWVLITDQQGHALNGASIVSSSTPSGQPAVSGSTTLDGDGHVSFISLVSGYYTFGFSHPAYDASSVTVYLGDSTWEKVTMALSIPSGGGGNGNGGNGGGDYVSIPTVIVVSSITIMLLVLSAIGLVRRGSVAAGGEDGAAHTQSWRGVDGGAALPSKERVIPPARTRPNCPNCGAVIELTGAEYCDNCGARLELPPQTAPRARRIVSGSCMICGMRIQVGSDTLRCPHCGRAAHRIHMLEWLHVKDYCPICQRHLEERDFSKPR